MKQIILIAAMFIAMLVIAVEEQTPAAELQLKMAELTTFSASFTQTTSDTDGFLPVSYTHLTLPTICSV